MKRKLRVERRGTCGDLTDNEMDDHEDTAVEPSAEAVAEQLARKVNELVPFFRADTSQFVRAFKPILDSFTRSKSERIRDETLEEAAQFITAKKFATTLEELAAEIRSFKSIQPEGKKCPSTQESKA
jgi:hypothetical protein